MHTSAQGGTAFRIGSTPVCAGNPIMPETTSSGTRGLGQGGQSPALIPAPAPCFRPAALNAALPEIECENRKTPAPSGGSYEPLATLN